LASGDTSHVISLFLWRHPLQRPCGDVFAAAAAAVATTTADVAAAAATVAAAAAAAAVAAATARVLPGY
jgi:hypothetical protein